METVIEVKNVTKKFKDKKAVNNISFTIKRGEIVAILGPNGAGKTTTLSMLLGLMDSTQGNVSLLGGNPKEKHVREKIGAMLQEVSVIDGLKVKEIISLFRSYYPNPLTQEELMKLTGLDKVQLNTPAQKLSGGQKRRLGFALAMTGNPDVLFFDEPTVGLDITARRVFWETIERLRKQGKTIIFTTHYLQEADDVATRILLFNEGSIVGDGTPDQIKGKLLSHSVSFITKDFRGPEILRTLSDVTDMYEKDGRTHVVTQNTDNVLAAIFKENVDAHDIQVHSGRLEEAFEQLTTKHEEVI